MGIFSTLILTLAQLFNLVMTVYIYIVVARAIISWVNPDPYNPIVRFLHNATDPALYRIRKYIPLQFGGLDFTPIIFLFALFFIQKVVSQFLMRLAAGF